MKKRLDYLDLAKGIGIILVVWAHARGPWGRYIAQFHMPFFFLISGYLYSRTQSLKEFTIRKIHSLYIPFAFWNLFFYWFRRVFTGEGFPIPGMLKFSGEILLTLNKDGQWLGATWFLAALFVDSVLYKFLDTLLERVRGREYILTALFAIIAVAAYRYTLPHLYSRNLILGFFYAVGVLVRMNRDRLNGAVRWYFAFPAMALFLLIGHGSSANMGSNEYSNFGLFLIGAMLASYSVIWFCLAAERYAECTKLTAVLRQTGIYLGKNSIDILIWQFVFFRVGILLQMAMAGETITVANVLSYYPVYDASHGWWIFYLACGLILPLLWGKLLRMGPWGKVLRKLYIIT